MEISNLIEKTPDISDQASNIEEIERQNALQKRIEAQKAEQEAVQTMDDKGNVLCEDCGIVIPEARLKSVPFAVQCIDCKATSETLDKRYV